MDGCIDGWMDRWIAPFGWSERRLVPENHFTTYSKTRQLGAFTGWRDRESVCVVWCGVANETGLSDAVIPQYRKYSTILLTYITYLLTVASHAALT